MFNIDPVFYIPSIIASVITTLVLMGIPRFMAGFNKAKDRVTK